MGEKPRIRKTKLYVAFLMRRGKPVVCGMVGGVTDAEARRRFAAERHRSVEDVVVAWTPNVGLDEYVEAQDAQIDFLTRRGGGR